MHGNRNQRWGLYKWNVLKILEAHPEGLHWSDLFSKLDIVLPPEPEELERYKSNNVQRRIGNIRFSTIALVKAGWMTRSRGIWALTDEGRDALQKFPSPDSIQSAASGIYNEWKSNRGEIESSDNEDDTIEFAVSIDEAEESAREIVSKYLADIEPYLFQDLVAALLDAMGYHVAWIAPPGKDGGMDLIAYQDPLGATGRRIKVQVKRRAEKIGVDSVRSFMGILGENDIGLYICSGGFSNDAERTVRESDNKRLRLIDSQQLFDLWVEYYEKMPQASRLLMPLRPIYHLDLPK